MHIAVLANSFHNVLSSVDRAAECSSTHLVFYLFSIKYNNQSDRVVSSLFYSV